MDDEIDLPDLQVVRDDAAEEIQPSLQFNIGVNVACESIQHQLNPHIVEEVQRYHEQSSPTAHPQSSA